MTSGQSFGDPGFGGGGNGGGGDQTRRATVVLDANTSAYGQQMAAASQQTSQLSAQVAGLVTSLDSLSKRAGRKLEILGAANFASLSAMTAGAAAFEKQLSTLHATAAVTGRDFGQMEESIHRLTKQFPISHESATQLATAISNLGVTGTRDIGKLAETFVKLGGATGEDIGGLAQNMVQLSRTMGNLDPAKIGNLSNALLTVSKSAGVSATGVLEFSQAIGPIARSAGISEAAVMGISTAFKKAGADGFVAANTFNSIVSDIAQLERSGSPAIAKYATLLGQTAQQFKAAGIQQNAMDLFQAFGQDNPRVRAFLDQNYGIRAQRALLAVGQSGDMQKYVNDALRASGNQQNLDKGSRTAFNNLVDDLTKLRNQVALLADEIGKPLLGVVDPLVKALTAMLSGVNAVVKGMGPLATTLAAALSVLGPMVGGFGLGHVGLLGAAGAARLALSKNSIFRQSVEAGRMDRRSGGLGELGASIAAGDEDLFYRQQAGYALGRGDFLGMMPFAFAGRGQGRVRGMGTGAGAYQPKHGAGLARHTEEAVLRRGEVPTSARTGMAMETTVLAGSAAAETEVARVAGRVPRIPPDVLAKMSAGEIADWYGVTPGKMKRFAAARAPGGFFSSLSTMNILSADQGNEGPEGRLRQARLSRERGITVPLNEMWENSAMAAASGESLFGAGARSARRAAREAARAAAIVPAQGARSLLAGVGSLAGMAGRAALPFLGTPLGLSMVGLPLALGGLDFIQGQRQKAVERQNLVNDPENFLNPVKSLNDSLGVATQYVVRFGRAVNEATPEQPKPMSISSMRSPTPEQVAEGKLQPKGKDEASKIFEELGKKGKLTPESATTVLRGLVASGMTDQRSLGQVFNAMSQAGMSAEDIGKAFQAVTNAQGVVSATPVSPEDLGALSRQVGGELGSRIAAIGPGQRAAQYQQGLGARGAGYAAATRLQATVGAIKALPKGQPTVRELARALNISEKDMMTAWSKFTSRHGGPFGLDTEAGILELIQLAQPSYISDVTAAGGAAVTGPGGELDYSKVGAYAASQTAQPMPISGPLKGNPLLRGLEAPTTAYARAQATPGNVSLIQRGSEEAYLTALRAAGGDTGRASAILMGGITELGGAAGGTPPALLEAAQYARQQQALTRPLMTTAQTTQQLQQNLQASRALMMQENAPEEAKDWYKADKQAYQEHVMSMLQQQRQFAISMQRGDEDYQRSRVVSERNYNIQIRRSRRDFGIQMYRQERDFGIQMNRTLEDRTRQLKNQTAQLAQTIYNPFERVVGKFTMDADTLYENLKDQNERLAKQRRQLDQLSRMGLSTEAIQTLNLANPENAQQLDALVQSAMNDPKTLAKINAMIRTRMALTGSLTQNQYSLEFVQSQREFTIQLDRTTADYKKAMKDARDTQAIALADAAENQGIALNDMAIEHGKAIKRAGEDLNNTVLTLTDSMGRLYPSALSSLAKAVEKYSPQAAASIRRTLDDLAKEFPGLQMKQNTTTGATTTGSMSRFSTTPSTTGATTGGSQSKTPPPPPQPQPGQGGRPRGQHGGIGVRQTNLTAFEAGPEALIPLNERGEAFMAATIVRSLAAAFQIVSRQAPAPVSQQMSADHSTNFNGPIQVVAQDTRQLERELAAKAKLRKLTSPTRRTG